MTNSYKCKTCSGTGNAGTCDVCSGVGSIRIGDSENNSQTEYGKILSKKVIKLNSLLKKITALLSEIKIDLNNAKIKLAESQNHIPIKEITTDNKVVTKKIKIIVSRPSFERKFNRYSEHFFKLRKQIEFNIAQANDIERLETVEKSVSDLENFALNVKKELRVKSETINQSDDKKECANTINYKLEYLNKLQSIDPTLPIHSIALDEFDFNIAEPQKHLSLIKKLKNLHLNFTDVIFYSDLMCRVKRDNSANYPTSFKLSSCGKDTVIIFMDGNPKKNRKLNTSIPVDKGLIINFFLPPKIKKVKNKKNTSPKRKGIRTKIGKNTRHVDEPFNPSMHDALQAIIISHSDNEKHLDKSYQSHIFRETGSGQFGSMPSHDDYDE